MHNIVSLRTNKHGGVAIEAAFMLPLFFLFVIGIIEFGRLYWVRSSMQLAVTEAGRYAMIHTDSDDSTLSSVVNASLYGLNSNDFSLSFATENNNGINYKSITAIYNYSFLTENLINYGAITLTTTSKVPILQ